MTSDLMDPARAGKLFTEAIAATERSGDRLVNYALHNNAGVHALAAGNIAAARAHLEQAAQAMQAIGEKNSPYVPINLGWVLREENDREAAQAKFETGLRMSRRTGDRPSLARASLGLACLAADRGDWQRAAALHGAVQACIDQIAEPWQEPEARYRRDSLHKVRASLEEEQFGRAYAKGTTLSLDDALDLALGRPRPA